LKEGLWLFNENSRRDRSDRRIRERFGDLFERTGGYDRIRIEATDEIRLRVREREVHRSMFAAVLFMEDVHLRIGLELMRHTKRIVA
jgi:hypothetical protein